MHVRLRLIRYSVNEYKNLDASIARMTQTPKKSRLAPIEELRDTELSRAILDMVGALVVVLDRAGRVVRFNTACELTTGYAFEDVRGRPVFDLLIPPDQVEAVRNVFDHLVSGDFPNSHENFWVTKSGARRLIAWRNTSILDSEGAVSYVVGTGLDVTEERRARAERDEVEERLRESEAASRELLETAAQGILAIDSDGRIVRVNALVCSMFGYTREEILGRKLSLLLPRGTRRAHASHVAGFFRHPERRPMGTGRDVTGLRKDGSVFPIEVALSSLQLDHLTLSVAFVSDISDRKAAERQIAEQNERLRQLTQRLTSSAETENRKWARELHDVYSQRLVAIALGLTQAMAEGEPRPELERLEVQARKLAEDIHHLSRRMHPSVLHDLGLVAALRSEAMAFQRESGIRTRFEAKDVPTSVADEVALCCYRVAQETLRNIRKHSQATSARISLDLRDGRLAMTIRDVGDGFDRDRALRKGGLGLISMEERVLAVDGDFAVESTPGKGSIVRVSVPLKD